MSALIPPSEQQSSVDALDFNLEELDDSEYGLPPIDHPPTLESILNEPDDEGSILEEDLTITYQGELGETSSISSQDSLLEPTKTKTKKRPKTFRSAVHGSIMKRVTLKNISAQLLSAADRVDAGMPTAMAVSSHIAIGTSHGLVLVFDPNQTLKCCLGSRAVGAQYGSVSSISFNQDCTRLLSGFARGQMTMWDLTNGKLIRTISDAHPPGSAVLHIKFTDDPTVAICNDSGGSVFELEMKRLIGVRTCESRCLFSGSRGEVCCIEPLHMNLTIKDHPMKEVLVLAMGTLSKVLVVTIKPKLRVIFSHPLKGDSSTLPLLAWQFVIIQITDNDRVIDPVLAFARDNVIHFYQAICNHADDIRFTFLQKLELDYKLLAVKWMNPKTLVALDTSERLHVIDVRSEEELEVIDMADVQLCYGTSHFKSLATGGNVSKALAYAGERACYSSIVVHAGQLLLLGTKTVHVMSIRNWMERIDVLVKQGHYSDALGLAQSFYEGKGKAVIGLLGGQQRRRAIVSDKMLDLLHDYVNVSMTRYLPERGNMQQLTDYYESVVPVCVDYCLTLKRTDVLFGKLYERFSMDEIAKGTFLECLEPYILQDQLSTVTPSIMKDFIDHYESRGLIQNVEQCVVHLDISSLDIHQVVGLCWSYGLYDAIIYVYNRGMQDYITPLQELFSLLGSAVQTGLLTDDRIRLGNKLLVYISCCLAGRAYPLGDIPEAIVDKVKDQVFRLVTCLHTKEHNEEESVYPHLRTLLMFDTREFLNVLALAFEEPEFNSEEGVEKRQRVVDILLQIMVEGVGFSPGQIGTLFTFLARQMARHENAILVNRVLFEQVLEFLASPGDEARHEERQQALMELLHAGGLQQFDEDKLLTLAENAKFYRICEMLYGKRRQFDKILHCYMRDPSRKVHTFSYIESIMLSDSYTATERETLKNEALTLLDDFIEMDPRKSAELVLTTLGYELTKLIEMIRGKPRIAFSFLNGVMEYRANSGSALYPDKSVTIEAWVHEYYIELMCESEPERVVEHLKTSEGYRPDQTLKICRTYGLCEPTAFLLELQGEIPAALDLLLDNLQSNVDRFTNCPSPDKDLLISFDIPNSADEPNAILDAIREALSLVIHLCQRNSGKLDEDRRQELWFPVLEMMMTSQRMVKERVNKDLWEEYKDLTRQVVNSMMGLIALPAILTKIMQDPSYNTGKFGEIRELIMGLLDTYNYEKTLLNTCNSLLNQDLHSQFAGLHRAANRGLVPKSQTCPICAKPYQTSDDTITVFRCGHVYHISCIAHTEAVTIIDGEEHWSCLFCTNAKRGRSTSFIRCLPAHPGTRSRTASQVDNNEAVMTEEQKFALQTLRKNQQTPSRLAILSELSKPQDPATRRRQAYNPFTQSMAAQESPSILTNQSFQLNLTPPPIDDS